MNNGEIYSWVFAILFFGVGDIATTLFGLRNPNIAEMSPVASHIFDTYGLAIIGVAMVALKVVCVGVLLSIRRIQPTIPRITIPLTLSVMGVLVVIWNSYIIIVSL